MESISGIVIKVEKLDIFTKKISQLFSFNKIKSIFFSKDQNSYLIEVHDPDYNASVSSKSFTLDQVANMQVVYTADTEGNNCLGCGKCDAKCSPEKKKIMSLKAL